MYVETSMDAMGWAEREKRFAKKFEIGKKYVPKLFSGFKVPDHIDQIVVLGYGGKGGRSTLGGARILLIADLLADVLKALCLKSMHTEAVPEQFLLLRTMHFVAQHRQSLRDALFPER